MTPGINSLTLRLYFTRKFYQEGQRTSSQSIEVARAPISPAEEVFNCDDPQYAKYNIERKALYTTYKKKEAKDFPELKQQFAVGYDRFILYLT